MTLSTDQIALARQYLSDKGSSAAQSILIENADGGTWTITFSGQTTSALAFNATQGDVQNALCALSNVGVGNVNVVNTAPYIIYFAGTLGNVAQPMLTVNSASLTSAGPLSVVVTVLQTTAGGLQAFSDDDLNALNTDAGGNFYLTIAYGYRVLMAGGARFDDYVAGQSQEKKSQIFDHLKDMEEMYIAWSYAAGQVQIVGLVGVPPRVTAVPVTSGVPATSLQYTPNGRWGPWGRGWRGRW